MRPREVIVVGGGIAGMACAARLALTAGHGGMSIVMLTKAPVQGSSSYAAQGGVAAVMDGGDSFERHIGDTLRVGEGRNDRRIVELVVRQAPAVIRELLAQGARFDADADGHLLLAREGGHSAARVVHHLDRTGEEIVRVLRRQVRDEPSVTLMEGQRVVDLLVREGDERRCIGVRAIDLATGDMHDRFADAVVLATGGIGQVFMHTTNPPDATGDGIAMAVRAGVPVRDMAFVQFHPTALHTGAQGQVPLISEAVRGAGARLLRHDGRPLMDGVHPSGDLAPRNVVARAIQEEMRRSGLPYALLDAGPIGTARFMREFPAIDRDCRRIGLVPGRDPLPVMPAAHYLCGGIATDDSGRTALSGLYALGECAGTGLHGADRLASNSLLEALVIPRRAADAIREAPHCEGGSLPRRQWPSKLSRSAPTGALRAISALRHAMSMHAGTLRDPEGLAMAMRMVARCERALGPMWVRRRWSLELINLRDLAAVARAVLEGALAEPVSAGTHHLVDRKPVEL